jgi:magnesium-transporting ATPase (P-type)
LVPDATYLTSLELIYRNYTEILLIPAFYGLSRPAAKLTRYYTPTNFLGFEQHLVYWGNLAITTVGFVAAYQRLIHSEGFIANPIPVVSFEHGYHGECQSTTTMFLCIVIFYLYTGIFIYRGKPWKESLYKNKTLVITLALNFAMFLAFVFVPEYFEFMGLVPIGMENSLITFAIMSATMGASWIFNVIVEKRALHQTVHNRYPGISDK